MLKIPKKRSQNSGTVDESVPNIWEWEGYEKTNSQYLGTETEACHSRI